MCGAVGRVDGVDVLACMGLLLSRQRMGWGALCCQCHPRACEMAVTHATAIGSARNYARRVMLGCKSIVTTQRYLGIETDKALAISRQFRVSGGSPTGASVMPTGASVMISRRLFSDVAFGVMFVNVCVKRGGVLF